MEDVHVSLASHQLSLPHLIWAGFLSSGQGTPHNVSHLGWVVLQAKAMRPLVKAVSRQVDRGVHPPHFVALLQLLLCSISSVPEQHIFIGQLQSRCLVACLGLAPQSLKAGIQCEEPYAVNWGSPLLACLGLMPHSVHMSK